MELNDESNKGLQESSLQIDWSIARNQSIEQGKGLLVMLRAKQLDSSGLDKGQLLASRQLPFVIDIKGV